MMLCWFFKVPWGDSGNLAANGVGVFTTAPRSINSVITPLAQFKATLGWKVTPQARQKEGHDPHGRPSCTTVRLAARARVVSTVVLIVIRTVIEETFHTAHASPIVNHVLGRAKALLVADPV